MLFEKKRLLTTLLYITCIVNILGSDGSAPQDNSLLASKLKLCIEEYNTSKSSFRTQSINNLLADIVKKHQAGLTAPQAEYLAQQVATVVKSILSEEVSATNRKKEVNSECIKLVGFFGSAACFSGGLTMIGVLPYPFNLTGGLVTLFCGTPCCAITCGIAEKEYNDFLERQKDGLNAQIYSLREQIYPKQPQAPIRPENDGSLARRILASPPQQIVMGITPTTTPQKVQPPHQLA